MNVTTNATSAHAKPPAAPQPGAQVSTSPLTRRNCQVYKTKDQVFAISVLLLSLAAPGVFRGKEPADERASDSPLRRQRAALRSQCHVRLGPAAGVHGELRAATHLADRRRLEVGRARELPPSPEHLRGHDVGLAVRPAVLGGPTGGGVRPHQEVRNTL